MQIKYLALNYVIWWKIFSKSIILYMCDKNVLFSNVLKFFAQPASIDSKRAQVMTSAVIRLFISKPPWFQEKDNTENHRFQSEDLPAGGRRFLIYDIILTDTVLPGR